MLSSYTVNTKKKRFAFEIIILLVTILVCSTIFFIGNYIYKFQLNDVYKKENIITSKLDSLNDNVFRNRYNNLNDYQQINDYSYESYKKTILNEKDSSFRRDIYNRLCDIFSKYRNEKSFDEFVEQFEYDSINIIDEQINSLNLQKNKISDHNIHTKDYYLTLIIIILLIVYPLRYIYYLMKWSIKTLKENNTEEKKNKVEEEVIILNKEYEKNEPKIESKFKNYFKYNNEYITGYVYWLRMIIGWITTMFFGIGLLLMSTTVYKRSKSLGYGKGFSIINSILIPILFIISILVMFYYNLHINSSDDNVFYEFILLRILLTIPHLILIFKNGTNKKIGKFEIN